jgi:hypothetical protein
MIVHAYCVLLAFRKSIYSACLFATLIGYQRQERDAGTGAGRRHSLIAVS